MPVVTLRYHETPPEAVRGGVVAVGNFDGVHVGHAALIAEAKRMADRLGGPVVPVTFDPHPLALLAPERFQPPLTTAAGRAHRLLEIGADHVVILHTTPELLALSPEYFFETIIGSALSAKGMVEGFNFRFGHNRAGSNDTLRSLCSGAGIEFQEVAAFEAGGKPVSSSRVREALMAGEIDAATALLDRPYRVAGTVVTGAKRGRTIGFPTANLNHVETLLPADGVYAVRALVGTTPFVAAANVGPNPTFGESARKVEVHLLDFNGNLYGSILAVDFVARLRETQKFSGVEALVEQMTKDVADAKRIVN